MSDQPTQRETSDEAAGDDLTFTRRTALALMGAGGVAAAASGSAAASHSSAGDGDPARKWNQDIDAQEHDLENLHALETDHVYASARDADVVVWKDDEGSWHADGREGHVATTDDVMLTTKAAIDSLTDGRDWKEKVSIVSPATVGPHAWGDGPWPGYKEIRVPSNTILDVPAPIHIQDADEPLIRAIYTKGAENVEFPNLNIKGNPRYAVWLQDTDNVRIGTVNIEMDADQDPRGGLGVRIDSGCTNVQVDGAYIKEAGWQAFETYDVTRLQVGQVLVDKTPGAGVLLNDTHDATIGAVVGREVNPGGGYSTFRVANGCSDVTCGQVVGRDGGRGFFAVSGNENVTVNALNVVGMSSHGVLIQDSQNVSVNGGVVKNSGAEGVRIDSRPAGGIPEDPRDFAATDGITVENLRIVDTRDEPQMSWGILETGPDTTTSRIVNNDVRGSGTDGAIQIFSPDSRVVGNVGGGVADGRVTLAAGADPAARVENVSEHLNAALEVRSRPTSDPGAAFDYESDVVWNGSAWDVVFTWDTDPGTDLEVGYVVDQEHAIGAPAGGGDGDGGTDDPDPVSAGVVDDFEDEDLDEYQGDTGGYVIDNADPVSSGSYSLKEDGGGTIISMDGLERYPTEGTTFAADVGYSSDNPSMGIAFGAQSASSFYFARVYRPDDGDPRLQLYSPESKVLEGTLDSALDPDTLYELEVDWAENEEFTVSLYDQNGNQLASRSGSTDLGIVEGGVGTRNTGYLDNYRITSGTE